MFIHVHVYCTMALSLKDNVLYMYVCVCVCRMHPVSHLCYLVDVLCHCSKRKLLALFMQQRMERFTLFITVCVCVFVCVDIIVIFKNCTNNIDVLAKITLQSLPHFQVYTFYIRGSPITNLTYQCATCIVPNKSPRQQTGGMQNAAFCQSTCTCIRSLGKL